MRLMKARLEQFLRLFEARRKASKIDFGRMQHLLRCQSAARVSAHTIGHHRQGHAAALRMWHQGNTVLLLEAVALMLRDTGIDHQGHDRNKNDWEVGIARRISCCALHYFTFDAPLRQTEDKH